jgi:hypothetical protein
MATLTAVAAAAAALALPALAPASTYCVGNVGGTLCDVSKPDTAAGLQAALTEAQSSSGVPDRVRIAPGTYIGNFTYSATNEVDVQGSGAATVIKGVGTDPALHVSASGSDSIVSDLELHMASVPNPQPAVGLRIGSAVAQNVRVQNPGDSWGSGIQLQPGGDVLDSTVLVGSAAGIEGHGAAAPHDVRDTFISGRHGVLGSTGTWTLERLRITARSIGIQIGGTGALHDSLIRVLGEPGFTSRGVQKLGQGVFSIDHVTIVGGQHATFGAEVAITIAGTSTLSMKNSILAGTFSSSSLGRWASGGGTANIVVGHSNFPPPAQSWVDANAGPGVLQQTPGGTNTNVDPKFVDPFVTLENPTVDFRLRHDSPLIDKGEPGGVQAEDLAGELRLVDGDGTDGPARDMGAYEYQHRAPIAVIAAPGAGALAAGAPVAFSAAGSGDLDAGDSLEYAWSFGDGATATGAAPSHAYDFGGQRIITLTVTDPTGLTATATRELLVEGPLPGSGSGSGTEPVDAIAPALSSVSLSAPAFRVDARAAAVGRAPRGTRVRFRLSEAAAVRFAIRRRSGGRRIGSFLRAGSAGPNIVRFTGRLRVRGRTLSLAPGRYHLTLVATDPSGNRSAARRLPFRVVSPRG